jgi:hypothetical protein
MMVYKKNRKWQMYTNFTILDKCCPKDGCALIRIDKFVDFAAGCEIMALLDYFQATIKYVTTEKTKKTLAL